MEDAVTFEGEKILVRAFEGGAFDDLVDAYWTGQGDADGDLALARAWLVRAEELVDEQIGGFDVSELAHHLAGFVEVPRGTIGLLARAERIRYHEGRP